MCPRSACLKTMTKFLAVIAICVLLFVAIANILVTSTTDTYLYSDVKTIPHNKVAILLGTSKYARNGGLNDHYRLRINAAYELFSEGKIDYILISGSRTLYYDEPSTIRSDLLQMGIPSNIMYRDYGGFRTIDSIIRAKNIFGLTQFTIISQGYHNNRALYIALNQGINAIAFNAGSGSNSNIKNKVREIMARVLAIIELHIMPIKTKQIPPTIHIGSTPPT
ncbi:MAG: ElyC/SanA/YdcF family protein [Candidatus Endonucleobacter bathymodioli]|uniref:ElyC/SanA/YdcF family protein n=1 Tax=Candidatus Endonucleibacter bathymodioli TaxID=539814 RepID=A0AA90NKT5_9GAMM|nr:ElyC/SanA/YdcF family protein [Candidatus Endonucleobacter bathymodioli]